MRVIPDGTGSGEHPVLHRRPEGRTLKPLPTVLPNRIDNYQSVCPERSVERLASTDGGGTSKLVSGLGVIETSSSSLRCEPTQPLCCSLFRPQVT